MGRAWALRLVSKTLVVLLACAGAASAAAGGWDVRLMARAHPNEHHFTPFEGDSYSLCADYVVQLGRGFGARGLDFDVGVSYWLQGVGKHWEGSGIDDRWRETARLDGTCEVWATLRGNVGGERARGSVFLGLSFFYAALDYERWYQAFDGSITYIHEKSSGPAVAFLLGFETRWRFVRAELVCRIGPDLEALFPAGYPSVNFGGSDMSMIAVGLGLGWEW